MKSQQPERMVPHSVEAEEAVLGSILINPDALYDVAPFLRADDFFIVKNGWIYEAILALATRQDSIDYVTVCEELRTRERLDEIGGAAYVTYLINHTPTSLYAESYGRIMERAAIRRRLLGSATDIAQVAYDEDLDIHGVIERAEASLAAATSFHRLARVERADLVISRTLDTIDNARAGNRSVVPTGLAELDDLLAGGFTRSDLNVLAGRPGMGKTSLMLTLARYVVTALRRPVLVASLEMSKDQLMLRLVSMETGINLTKLKTGKLTDAEYARVVEAVSRIDRWPLYLDDTPGITATDLRVVARRLHGEVDLAILMVDYLQLMEAESDYQGNREQQISRVSRGLKAIARELNIPVLAISQLSREVEKRADKRPVLSDLRDSGAIEQDSDTVLLLYRDEYYNPSTTRIGQTDAILAKNRNGPTGSATLFFRREQASFANLQKIDLNLAAFDGPPDGD